MALIGINPVRRPEEKDLLDKIIQGVGIARGVLGLATEIPDYLQRRKIGDLQVKQAEANIARSKSDMALKEAMARPLTPEEQRPFSEAGVQPISLPRTVAEAEERRKQLFETPGALASRQRQEAMLGFAKESAARAGRKEERDIIKSQTIDEKSAQKLSDLDSGISKIEEALSIKRAKAVETGPVIGRVIPEFLKGQNRIQMEQLINTGFDDYRRAVTGAQAAERELAILKTRLPQSTDTDENFQTKATGTIKGLRRVRALFLDNQRKRGKDVSQFLTPEDENLIAESKARSKVITEINDAQEWLSKNSHESRSEMVKEKVNRLLNILEY